MMKEQLLTAVVLLALVAVGAVAAIAPRALLRRHYLARAFGLTEGVRAAVTRAAGVAVLIVCLWLSWRLLSGVG